MDTYQWHIHPSYKNLYESEIDILTRGLKGDFKLLKLYDPLHTNGRVVLLGELSYNEGVKQGIQIIFPTKYPYAPPRIIAVTLVVDKTGNISESANPFLFGKGNQYGDGAMCLFRNEIWNKDQHNIGWVLRRAQKWLRSANANEGFKTDEIVEENPAPIKHHGQVLIPREIDIPKNTKSGHFILTQFKPYHYILEQNILPEPTFTLSINKESFKWYAFDKEITFKDLFPIMDAQTIVNVFNNHFGVNIIEGESIKNIAFYLPGDKNSWHFFKLIIQPIGNQVQIIPQYYLARQIQSELYLRTKDIFDDQILLQKRVTIIGLGAIGSEVAKSLAKNGVGHFNLFDMDTFEIGNSIRHAADLYYIGEDKVKVVKQLILRANPNITVNPFKIDVLNDSGFLERSLKESDLCIVLTAEDSVDYLINDHYVRNFDIPFIFARVSAGAFSGAVQIVTKESACLRCLSKSNVDKLPQPTASVEFTELKSEYGSCSSPAIPGSEIDTKEVALQVARVSIQALLQNENTNYPKISCQQYYWHGPFGTKEQAPFTWEMKNHTKHIDCKTCL